MIIIIICTTCYSSNSSRQIALYFTRDVCSLMVYIFPLLNSSYLFSSLSIFSLLISSRHSLACLRLHYFLTSVPPLFSSILSHSAFFDFVLYHSILFYPILFCLIRFCPILSYSMLFCLIRFCPIFLLFLFFHSILSYYILYFSVLHCSVLCNSTLTSYPFASSFPIPILHLFFLYFRVRRTRGS